jgi:anti-sigma factor RsiW
MMSLALDGLLDEADRGRFEAYQAQYPALAAMWIEWQGLDRELEQMPHAEPAAGFVGRFEARLAQREAEQQRRVLAFSLVSVALVAVVAVAAAVWGFTVLTSTQGPWLGEQIHNLVYLSATTGAWFNALLDTLGALANTPQAQALGMMYVVVAIVMIFGWVQLLRRSTRLATAGALPPGME